MRRTTGSALDQNKGVILVTTNSTLKIVHSELIMGAGIAKAACDSFPRLPAILGNEIIKRSGYNNGSTFQLAWYKETPFRIFRDYNVILSPNVYDKKLTIGAFQTEREYWLKSPIELVLASAEKLAEMIEGSRLKDIIFHLPAPSEVARGGLDESIIFNELSGILPDNVIWYDYEEAQIL